MCTLDVCDVVEETITGARTDPDIIAPPRYVPAVHVHEEYG